MIEIFKVRARIDLILILGAEIWYRINTQFKTILDLIKRKRVQLTVCKSIDPFSLPTELDAGAAREQLC